MDKEDQIIEELEKIRALLEPKPLPPAPPAPKGLIKEFESFISTYKVMGLAVAFIIGLYLGALVQALVTDLIMPIIQFATHGIVWENIDFGPFRVGDFAGSLLTFFIILIVVFIMIKMTTKMGIK